MKQKYNEYNGDRYCRTEEGRDESGYMNIVRENRDLKKKIDNLMYELEKSKQQTNSDSSIGFSSHLRNYRDAYSNSHVRRRAYLGNYEDQSSAEYSPNYKASRSKVNTSQDSTLRCHPLRKTYAEKNQTPSYNHPTYTTSDTYPGYAAFLPSTLYPIPYPSSFHQADASNSNSSVVSPAKASRHSREDSDLKDRINALKESIKEIETKQEQLLNRIESKINKKEYEREGDGEKERFDRVYTKTLEKSKQVCDRYSANKHEFSIKESPPQQKHKKEIERQEVNEEKIEEKKPKETATRFQFEGRSRMPYRKSCYLNNDLVDNREYERVVVTEPQIETNYQSPERIDLTAQKIVERNKNVMMSRSIRSPSSRRQLSPSSKSDNSSITRSPLLTSDKIHNKYELVNDSFGSPDPKQTKAKKTCHIENENNDCPCFACNDPIIKNLQAQEHLLENFVPLSRIEPVPVSMSTTDMAITYNSSPNAISYQYEQSGSPPQLKKTRKKLFSSPSHKREIKEDRDPEYRCNPDGMSSMRATDLHCGRGSSPLRTRLKSSPSAKSKSKSPKKEKSRVYYCYEDGLINIKTPLKQQADNDSSDEDSPKTRVISDLKKNNEELHAFQRRYLKYNVDSDLYREINRTQSNQNETKYEVKPFCNSPNKTANTLIDNKTRSRTIIRRSKDDRNNENLDTESKSEIANSVINKSPNSRNQSAFKSRSCINKNCISEDRYINEVQRRKEELFQKKQSELKMKLQKKEAKRKLLSSTKWTYTPKRGLEVPNVPSDFNDQRETIDQRPEWRD